MTTAAAQAAAPRLTIRRLAWTTGLGWLAMLSFDFFWHGGVLAGFYDDQHPALLAPGAAFRLIPVGYLSLLITVCLLIWLALRLGRTGVRAGVGLGLKVGGVMQAASMLGLLSITTVPPVLLLGWWLGLTLQAGLAGAVIGASLGGQRLARLAVAVLALLVVCVVVTVLLQSLGLAPALRVSSAGAR